MIERYTILLVEDNEADARLLLEMTRELSDSVIELTHVKRLSDAIQNLNDSQFDSILLDLGLPDSLGLETLSKLNPLALREPVIILTGQSDKELGIKAIQAGAQDYLIKGDISPDILAKSLRYAIERKKNLLELAQAKAAIEENARLLSELNSSKDKFFSIVAHDLRSPFSALLAYSEFLSHNIEEFSPEEIKTFSLNIHKSLKKVLALLENLLDWAQLQSGRMEFSPSSFDIITLIKDIVEIYRFSAEGKGIILKSEISQDLCVFADKNMINTVLRNLLSNAIKFTDKGGSITLSARLNSSIAEITVSDTGIGMPTDVLNKLFKIEENVSKFGTSKEKGSGLGLILSKEFVEKNGGTITVQSEPEKGSIFTFTLPVSKQ